MQEALIKQHSPIGASSCERWVNCPASAVLSQETTKAAATGTVAHSLAEEAYKSGNWPTYLANCRGDKREQDGYTIEITPGMIDAVREYLCVLDGLQPDRSAWQLEKTIHLDDVDPEAFGTLDACTLVNDSFGERWVVVDYKNGFNRVSEESPQLWYYALGLKPMTALYQMVIVQPNAEGSDAVRCHFVSRDTLLEFKGRLMQATSMWRRSPQHEVFGPWCKKYCPRAGYCQTYRENTLPPGMGETMLSHPVKPPEPGSLSEVELSTLLSNAEALQRWVKGVQSYCLGVLERGGSIPEWGISEIKGHRTWVDGAEAKVVELVGEAAWNAPTLKSPAQIEKLFTKKERPDLSDLVITPSRGYRLNPLSSGGCLPELTFEPIEI